MTTPEPYQPLTELNVPNLYETQITMLTREAMHAHEVMPFHPEASVSKLLSCEGQQVIGADFGGDKGVTKLFTVRNGQLVISDEYEDYVQGDGGEGYLQSFERTAAFATERHIPVGISWGAPLDGSRPLPGPKFAMFNQAITERYGGDFANLLPTLRSCINDGPAGLISGAIEAYRTRGATTVLLAINGGGLGMAILADDMIYAAEPGHTEAIPELNTHAQAKPCGVFDADFVCLETLGANKAGIEAQWQQITGEYLSARDIEDRYKQGNELGKELYDHSALVVAHMIAGTARAFGIDLTDRSTVVVGHGGAFKFPHYGERIQQILSKATDAPVALIMTKDYGDSRSNACLDGAALAALLA